MSGRGSPQFWAVLQPIGAIVSSAFAFGVLLVATRDGQFSGIAGFAAGGAVVAIASVLAGGGTTLAYASGDVARRRAVRAVRSRIVMPVVLAATTIAAFGYGVMGPLPIASVGAGGLAVTLGVGAELDTAYLRGGLRTGVLLISDVSNRTLALALTLLGVPFAQAMLAGAAFRAIFLLWKSREDPSRTAKQTMDRDMVRLAFHRGMTTLSILYSVADRLAALLVPFIAPVAVAGGYTSTISAQQNASGALMTGLQTTMAVRSQGFRSGTWVNKFEFWLAGAAVVASLVAVIGQELIWSVLGLTQNSSPGDYWAPIMWMIAAGIISRLFEFRLLVSTRPSGAAVSRALATGTSLVVGIWALMESSVAILAWGLLGAEVLGLVGAATILTYVTKRDVKSV